MTRTLLLSLIALLISKSVFAAKVKEEYLDEFLETASLLTKETRGKRKGCISDSFNQRQDDPTEFVLYEQWETENDLNEHIRQLAVLLGPPKPGGVLPEKLVAMYASAKPVYYNEVQ
ncbi:MAG: antibiotic biosynthesis monooxygenase family protein [Cellvibrionaceae bacterium]